MIGVSSKLVSVCILLQITLCSSLYEDQVGKFDWKRQFVGKVKFSLFDVKSEAKKVFVATESNVVAAISLQTGAIVWRQVLETDGSGSVEKMFMAGGDLVTVCGTGPYLVRGWNPRKGTLSFEWPLASEENLSNEYMSWDDTNFFYVQLTKGGLDVSVFQLKTGNALPSTRAITSTWVNAETRCRAPGGSILACLSGSNLYVLDLSGTSQKKHTLDFSPSSIDATPQSTLPSLILTLPNGSKKIAYNLEDNLKLIDAPSESWVLVREKNSFLLSLQPRSKMYSITQRFIDDSTAVNLATEAKWKFPFGDGFIVGADCYRARGSSSVSCYTLVTGEDHSAALINLGKGVMWVREEALARVVSVEMLDLPISDNEAAIEKEFASKEASGLGVTSGVLGMFVRRLTSQSLQFGTLTSSLLGLNEHSDEFNRWPNMVKDTFGLHKLIIVVTDPSKVYGIDNENGEVVWQRTVRGTEPCQALGKPTVPIYIQRTTRVLPHSPIWTLLLKNKESTNSALFSFNPITGQPMGETIFLSYKVAQAILLPTPNTDFIRGLVVLSNQGQAQVFPDTAAEEAYRLARGLFVYTVDPGSGKLTGYSFAESTAEEIKAIPIWSLKLAGSIFAVTSKNPHERVHSQGRVLGDRSVLYKYINPNLIAVGTMQPDPVHKSVLTVYLIDTVIGSVVFAISHKRVTEPVHFVHSENWVVYSYFSDKFRRTELVALDLFEGKTQRNTTAFSSIMQPIIPFVERQAYIFPQNIVTMKETITEKGITSKHLLVGTSTGRVIEVPWAILDPRRPIIATQEMREEGIFPYIPELNLPPEAIITYNHTLHNIVGIHTSPSGLESTCLVFIYGLDFFYIRVAPSKTFDVLKDDFEYWLISAVLLGLTLAAYVTKRLSAAKALRQAWK